MRAPARKWIVLAIAAVAGTVFAQSVPSTSRTKLLLLGDVNLGRAVGQQILKGNVAYPFELVAKRLQEADIVFVNLESQLSDQKGVTQHPKYNMVFTGPPQGAVSLREANISVVSTANNHAYDYGQRALRETIESLQKEGVQWIGTSVDSTEMFVPAIAEHGDIKIGFLAYTQFVNPKSGWGGKIALFERGRVQRDIEALKGRVDLIVVSYHAGAEYVDAPSVKLKQEFQFIAECGADLVVGHHPHYVQGIGSHQGKLIFYSLGNFVFYQPQREWTQFGLGVECEIMKQDSSARITQVDLLALRAGLQPSFGLTLDEERRFYERLRSLSTVEIVQRESTWSIIQKDRND